jgi:hypothetical protein
MGKNAKFEADRDKAAFAGHARRSFLHLSEFGFENADWRDGSVRTDQPKTGVREKLLEFVLCALAAARPRHRR